MSAPVSVRIVIPHQHVGDIPDYHEWINTGQKVKADRRGHPNPRMVMAEWQRWICNNTDCAGLALVHENAIVALIEGAE